MQKKFSFQISQILKQDFALYLQRQIGTVDTFKNARLTGAGTPHYTDKFTLMQRETDIAAALDSFAQIMQIKIFRQPFNGKYLHNSS